MRKIWIVISLKETTLSYKAFKHCSHRNELCLDVNKEWLKELSEGFGSELIYINNEIRFYFEEKLICIVKQIIINTQEFMDVPNSKIKEQLTSY